MALWWRKDEAGLDGNAMLAELRAIRESVEHLSERIGQAATRDDLTKYVTNEVFKHHLESHQKSLENWRVWLPWAVMVLLGLLELANGHLMKLLGG